ncbi:MAG: geranylgeranyl reductase family protein [Promethearchaeota archaeon]
MDRELAVFDVCIIGGSIAGNYLSYLLSKTSLKIIVIEEHDQIGVPLQCAGIVSQKLSKLIELPPELILNRVKTAKIVAPAGKYIKLSGNEKPYIIDRIGLDRLFYEKIKHNNNIQYNLGEKFKNLKIVKHNHKKLVLIKTNKRNIRANILVGCDGPLSSVGKILGVKNNNLFASQIRIKGQFDENEAVLFFNRRWSELFGWIVPEGNKIYRIGIATSKNIHKKFQTFLNNLKISSNHRIDQQGGIIPYGLMNKLAFENVLLLGDSACQVKATTGGGIIMLLTAAKYAANCIKNCFKFDNFSRNMIKKYYEIPCRLTIGKELKLHYLIRLILERLDKNDFIKLFEIVKINKIENLINIYGDMDFPKALILKLIKNPLVISFFVRLISKNPDMLVKFLRLITK